MPFIQRGQGGRLVVWISLGLAMATIASVWPVVHAQFINYDDNEYVTHNPMVLHGLNWQGIKWAFTTRHASNWHPLTWMSHMLDVSVFGKGARGPHVVNLALHVANTLLCFLVLRGMTSSKTSNFKPQTSGKLQTPNSQIWRCAVAAALFGLHPLHVESVAWVAER